MGVYRIQESLLGPAERSLHQALSLIVCQRGYIFPKVKLSQLFASDTPSNPLLNQEIDFLICERLTTQPILAVLLQRRDPAVPNAAQQQAAALCTAAGLPLLQIEERPAYRMDELLAAIEPYLQGELPLHSPSTSERLPAEPRPPAVIPTRPKVTSPRAPTCLQESGVALTTRILGSHHQKRDGHGRSRLLN